MLFTDYLTKFWDYETSPYVREKLAHEQSMGRRHVYESTNRIKRYWAPVFAGRKLNEITRSDLKHFALSLKDKNLTGSSINKILFAGTTALKWAFNEGMISTDPTIGFMRFALNCKKRGVLTPEEVTKVFSVSWKEERSFVGNLLACTTGLRAGEVLALRKEDITDNALAVNHSWSPLDGLKCPKNGESRMVPLFPEVRKRLLNLLAANPHKTDNPFIFYGLLENKPMDTKFLIDGLKDALVKTRLSEEDLTDKAKYAEEMAYWNERGVVFHSWRHYYAARMVDRIDAGKVSRITGHKSRAIFDQYADHITEKNLEEVAAVGVEVFKNVLEFPGESAAS